MHHNTRRWIVSVYQISRPQLTKFHESKDAYAYARHNAPHHEIQSASRARYNK